jgi:hypothetical protein
MPIRVITLANLINEINPMPNYTLTLYSSIKLYTSIKSLKCQKLAVSCCGSFKCSYINYYAYKVVYSIAGHNYSYIIGKGVLISYKKYCIIYNCN